MKNRLLVFSKTQDSIIICGPRGTTDQPIYFERLGRSHAMSQAILKLVEASSLKSDLPNIEIGDTVNVHTRILEGNKERIQVFTGTVIAMSGSGSREMFTVRRIVEGEGVERKFPLHSPRINKIEITRKSRVRRAKLYYLRQRSGKSVRLRERRV